MVPEIGIREDRQLRAGEIIDAAAASGAIPKCRNGKDFLLRHELMRDRSLMPQLKQVPGEEWFEGEGPPWK